MIDLDQLAQQVRAGLGAIADARTAAANDVLEASTDAAQATAIAEDALAQRALVVDWATAATVEDLAGMVQDQMITMLDRQVVIMQALADLYRHRATTSASTVLTHEASEYLARNQFQAESLTRGLSPRRGCMTRRHLPVPTPPDAE